MHQIMHRTRHTWVQHGGMSTGLQDNCLQPHAATVRVMQLKSSTHEAWQCSNNPTAQCTTCQYFMQEHQKQVSKVRSVSWKKGLGAAAQTRHPQVHKTCVMVS